MKMHSFGNGFNMTIKSYRDPIIFNKRREKSKETDAGIIEGVLSARENKTSY